MEKGTFEDVFPIENGDIPARVIWIYPPLPRIPVTTRITKQLLVGNLQKQLHERDCYWEGGQPKV